MNITIFNTALHQSSNNTTYFKDEHLVLLIQALYGSHKLQYLVFFQADRRQHTAREEDREHIYCPPDQYEGLSLLTSRHLTQWNLQVVMDPSVGLFPASSLHQCLPLLPLQYKEWKMLHLSWALRFDLQWSLHNPESIPLSCQTCKSSSQSGVISGQIWDKQRHAHQWPSFQGILHVHMNWMVGRWLFSRDG